jgi:hypothetical protein
VIRKIESFEPELDALCVGVAERKLESFHKGGIPALEAGSTQNMAV